MIDRSHTIRMNSAVSPDRATSIKLPETQPRNRKRHTRRGDPDNAPRRIRRQLDQRIGQYNYAINHHEPSLSPSRWIITYLDHDRHQRILARSKPSPTVR